MEPPIIPLEFNHPVAVALRRQMKGDYIHALSHIPAAQWKWGDNARLMLFGSTLMHQLHYIDGTEFPYMGARISDIDIAAWRQDGNYGEPGRGTWKDFSDQFQHYVPPLLKEAALKAGFDVKVQLTPFRKEMTEKWKKDEKEELDPECFGRSFLVYRVFDAADVQRRLFRGDPQESEKVRRDREELEKAMRQDSSLWDADRHRMKEVNLKVFLTISPHSTPFRMTLNPEPLYPGSERGTEGRIPLLRANRLDMMAGKLARLLVKPEEFKPGDFIDIYNICRAEPPILKLDRDELKALWLLTVIYIADMGYSSAYEPNGISLKIFENIPDNRSRFLAKVQEEAATHRYKDLEKDAGAIIETVGGWLKRVFPPPAHGVAYGPLHYTKGEKDFTAAIFGKDTSPLTPRSRDAIPDCRIDPSLLSQDYGPLAERLADRIIHNPWLRQEVENARQRHEGQRGVYGE